MAANHPAIDLEDLSKEQEEPYRKEYQKALFPGAKSRPEALAAEMSSPDPTSTAQSKILVDKGFDACEDASEPFEESCGDDWFDGSGHCFMETGYSTLEDNPCHEENANRVQFQSDDPNIIAQLKAYMAGQIPGKTILIKKN